jgi:hypothetical protein
MGYRSIEHRDLAIACRVLYLRDGAREEDHHSRRTTKRAKPAIRRAPTERRVSAKRLIPRIDVDALKRRIASPERGCITMPEMPPAIASGTATESPVAADQAALGPHKVAR